MAYSKCKVTVFGVPVHFFVDNNPHEKTHNLLILSELQHRDLLGEATVENPVAYVILEANGDASTIKRAVLVSVEDAIKACGEDLRLASALRLIRKINHNENIEPEGNLHTALCELEPVRRVDDDGEEDAI